MVFAAVLFFGFFTLILFHSLSVLLIYISLLILSYLPLRIPDKVYKIYIEDKKLFIKGNSSSDQFEEIVDKEFSWNYYYLEDLVPKKAKSNIILKLEVKTSNYKEYIFCNELNQWNSLPKNWTFKHLPNEKIKDTLTTRSSLKKLKQTLKVLDTG